MAAIRSLILWLISLSISHTLCAQQKIQTTRTALHVARSLDPDAMESISVKTKAGDLTTIIVKKRRGKSNNFSDLAAGESGHNETDYTLLNYSASEPNTNISADDVNTSKITHANFNLTTHTNRTHRSEDTRIPHPVYISSYMMFVKHDRNSNKKGKNLLKVDSDGIPIVTGVREHDDESDKQVWRNARVINGILVPYDESDKEMITKHKPSGKPSTMRPNGSADGESWTGISSPNKKPAKVSASLDQKSNLSKKPSTVTLRPIYDPSQVLQTVESPDNAERTRPASNEQYLQHPTGLWLPQEAKKVPEHKYVTDRILEYIRNINKEETKRLSMQKFTVRDARMLSTSSDEQPQIQSRILHVPGASVFPNSAIYSASTQQPSRVSFEEGVRTPVLQYAHPEYGVQTAKSEPSSGEIQDRKVSSYYPADIHADRGPFVFEPAAPTEQPDIVMETSKRSHTVHQPPPFVQRPKKTFPYFYPDTKYFYSTNNKHNAKYSSKDDYRISEYPTSLYYEDADGRPFWIRIGDSLKEQVRSGIDKMTDLTRPVVEPLVEATHKISHNLGFSTGKNRDTSTIREKLGSVSASSLILPAIGIMAGGAALGLGAVAVGRYLNYDVVKMRNAKSMNMEHLQIPDTTAVTHLEALWAEDNSRSAGFEQSSVIPSTEETLSSTPTTSSTTTSSTEKSSKMRSRRSIKNGDLNKYLENMLQSVESFGEPQSYAESYPPSMWTNTPCSKRIFCEVMLTKSDDSVALMDKKIQAFLSLIQPEIAFSVSPHLEEVMRSVKSRNCAAYVCPSWMARPADSKAVNDT